MKMTVIKRACLLLALLLGLQAFAVACQPADEPAQTDPVTDPVTDPATDPSTESDTEPETEPEPEGDIPLTIYENDAFRYCIVYPDNASADLTTKISAVQTSLRGKTKKEIETVKLSKLTDQHDDLHRIYVGVSPASIGVEDFSADSVRMGDYVIGRVEEDLYVFSYGEIPMTKALEALAKQMVGAYADKKIVIDEYSCLEYDRTYALAAFPAIEPDAKAVVGTMRPSENLSATQYYVTGIGAADANNYFSRIEEAGLQKQDSHRIGDARFGTYYEKNRSYVYFVSYHSSVLRITYLQKRDAYLPTTMKEPSFTKVCDTKGYLIGVADSGDQHRFQNGMSMAYLLADGTFLVYDGGQKNYDADKLYQLLSSIARENGLKKVTVSAWIITHSHGDHVGFWPEFLADYVKTSKVTIEKLFFNPVTADMGEEGYRTGMRWNDNNVIEKLKAASPTTKIYNLFTGQKFYLADVLVEVFFTTADHLPSARILDTSSTNAASLVTRLTIDGKTVLMTG
ncbi:MAG: MBL fold metallo-hydrolase, partial [Clostridia bacterium]|nr:MBL fold metallo-hydrolase [Clostridia bacterium]